LILEHSSIDIETLSLENNSVVLSIGIHSFSLNSAFTDSYYCSLNIDEQLKKNRHISGSTLSWWMEQSDQAKEVFSNNGNVPIKTKLNEIVKFVDYYQSKYTWTNGPEFDSTILKSLFTDFDVKYPFSYKYSFDFRTIKHVGENIFHIKYEPDKEIAHNALNDSIMQAKYIKKILLKSFNN
jgi:hypothetical protein